jgi:hypothetical protein
MLDWTTALSVGDARIDAGLAQHLKNVGFDSNTETLADPGTVRPASMSGCGTVSCS